MTIKNMLVSFNGSDSSKSALALAVKLAGQEDMHLTGVLAHGLPAMLYAYGGQVPQAAMDQLEDADRLHRAEVEKAFKAATSTLPRAQVHYLDIYGEADEMLMETALGYDLVVMGPPEQSPNFPHMQANADVVARNSGKPVLMVPTGYDISTFTPDVLLAWDGKRAAARALSDIIKLVPQNADISVLCVGEETVATEKAAPALTQLERHGFAPHLVTQKTRKIAKAILATAQEAKVGMIAMGAYEHAKLAEDLFGGVTNTILKKSKIPVLLSH